MGGMNDHEFASIVTAVIVANAVTAAFLFAIVRIRQRDAWDWYSASSMLFASFVGGIAAYLAS